jgi:hypothetical protein
LLLGLRLLQLLNSKGREINDKNLHFRFKSFKKC